MLCLNLTEIDQIIIDASIAIKESLYGKNTLYLNPESGEVETLELWLDYFKNTSPNNHVLDYVEKRFSKLKEVVWNKDKLDWEYVT